MKKYGKIKRFCAVFAATMMILSTAAFAFGESVTVTYHGSSHSYLSNGTKPAENLHGIFSTSDGKPAYCAEHGIPSPMGDIVGNSISLKKTPYNSVQIRKILYYGYKGVEPWPGFASSIYNSVYQSGFAGDYSSGKTESCGNAVTSTALTKAYGGSGRYYNVSGLAEFETFIASKPDPSGFTAILLPSQNGYRQDLFTWEYNPAGRVKIKKEILNNSHLVTECPQNYSLAGAVYGVYKSKSDAVNDSNRVLSLTTNGEGHTQEASLNAGKYYVKEISAPKGFDIDVQIHEVVIKSGELGIVQSKDAPLFDPLGIRIIKKAQEGVDSSLSLEGAEYTVRYYREFLDKNSLLAKQPYKTWIFRTDKKGEIRLWDEWKVGGDELFKEEDGTPVGLFGTYTFEETKAPAGFVKTEGIISVQQIKPEQLSMNPSTTLLKDVTDIEKPVYVEIEKISKDSYGIDFSLSGAELQLLDSRKKLVKTFISTGKPTVFIGLSPGTYYVREIKAPAGYIKSDDDLEIEVKESAQVQSFKFFNEPVPKIKTFASFYGNKNSLPNKTCIVNDLFEYSDLVVGCKYIVKGSLINIETGKEVASSKALIEPDVPSGKVMVTFEFDGIEYIDGAAFTVIEKLYRVDDDGEKLVASHEDLKDMNQTVMIPALKTTATDKNDGDNFISCNGKQTITDRVEYKNLFPGKKYKIRGVLINKATGEPVLEKNMEIVCEKEFTPEKSEGYIEMEYTFSPEPLKGNDVVVFENLYENDIEIGTHADIDDKNQTISVETPEELITGDRSEPFLLAAIILLSLLSIALMLKIKESEEKSE